MRRPESLPLRDAFAVLFFVSVGMLFDPAVLVERPLQVLAVTLIIVSGKSIAPALLVLALRYPLSTALTVSTSLAQIGEFSFILMALGAALGVVPDEGRSLVVAGALLSMALNPLFFGPTSRCATGSSSARRWRAASRPATTPTPRCRSRPRAVTWPSTWYSPATGWSAATSPTRSPRATCRSSSSSRTASACSGCATRLGCGLR